MTIHYTFYKGKKIIVTLRNGEKIEGKFKEGRSKGLVLFPDMYIPYIKISDTKIVKAVMEYDK